MLKRSFKDIDLSLPPQELEANPEVKYLLSRINDIEEKIDELIIKKKRVALAMNTEPMIRTKILRVFVYSRFFKASHDDPAHFIVHVDGVLLDADKSYYQPHMASFFDKVNAQVDKKFNQGLITAEWNRDICPQGVSTDGFAFKLYHDKVAMCKIQLHRNSDVRPRYELSSKLRSLVPLISVACTEEEVVLAVWQCVTSREDWFSRDSKAVLCDNRLREIFGVESFNISTLRSLVQKHLLPLQPIQIEHHLNPQAPNLLSLSASRGFSYAHFVKCGGRAFDIEVDAFDGHSFDQISSINKLVLSEQKVNAILGQKHAELAYLARKLNEKSQSLDLLDNLKNKLGRSISSSSSSSSDDDDEQMMNISSSVPLSSSSASGPSSHKALRRAALVQAAFVASSNPFRLIINRGVPKNVQMHTSAAARESRYQAQHFADREQATEDSEAAMAHQRARSSSFEALKKEMGGGGHEEEEEEDDDDDGEEEDEEDEEEDGELDEDRASTMSPFVPQDEATTAVAASSRKDQGGLDEEDDEDGDEDDEEEEEVNAATNYDNNNDNEDTKHNSVMSAGDEEADGSGAMETEMTSGGSTSSFAEKVKTERLSSSSAKAKATAVALEVGTKKPSVQKGNFNALHKSDILGSMGGSAPCSALYVDNALPGTTAAVPLRKVVNSRTAAAAGANAEQPLYADSCIHGLSGYFDVGNDALFSASLPWVKRAVSLLAAASSTSSSISATSTTLSIERPVVEVMTSDTNHNNSSNSSGTVHDRADNNNSTAAAAAPAASTAPSTNSSSAVSSMTQVLTSTEA